MLAMIRQPFVVAAFAALALSTAAPAAAAQIGLSDIRMGAEVRGSDGTLGRVETVVTDAAGRAQQVMIRGRSLPGTTGPLKSLPISVLRADHDGYTVALKKSEFALLPSAKGR